MTSDAGSIFGLGCVVSGWGLAIKATREICIPTRLLMSWIMMDSMNDLQKYYLLTRVRRFAERRRARRPLSINMSSSSSPSSVSSSVSSTVLIGASMLVLGLRSLSNPDWPSS